MVVVAPHRWSGWPGAWCLDCGIEDPMEHCVANHEFGAEDDGQPKIVCEREECKHTPCPEPGSRRHDPYGRSRT